MRKWFVAFLCVLLCGLPVLAGAEASADSDALIFTGTVEAKETTTVYAPFGGAVNDFTLRAGDRVSGGAALLSLDTVKVYAPCDGTVRGVFGQAGDSAAYVQDRYGALCYIEPSEELVVLSALSQGYISEDNRILHIGETVYLECTNDKDREGVGRVTNVNVADGSYCVEVRSGTLEYRDSVNIYRDRDYDSESRIGRGTLLRIEALPVSAEGSILSVAARNGAKVARGDLLFEMVAGSLDAMEAPSATLRATQSGIVASIAATPGQTVAKNQPLLTLYTLDKLQLVASVDELDVRQVAVGDAVRIAFDSLPGIPYEGAVASISGLGSPSENYTSYRICIDFTPDSSVLLGMSGTAYPAR